ncbi:MAG TPA: hypothetical protein VF746_28895 [Longimicrobium sp.]|jgi:hypothetical protein
MTEADELVELRLRPRPAETVELSIPLNALATIRDVAAARDMSPEALMRLYIGQGLRQDVSRLFAERIQAED